MAQLATRRNGPSYARLSPAHEFEDIYDRMGQLMSAAFGDLGTGKPADLPWVPLADVSETDDAYTIELDLPGVKKDQIDIQATDRELVVSGEITEKVRDRLIRKTRRVGKFEHRLTLPGDVNTGQVSAQLHDGVLTITVPKSEVAKPRHIEISG